MAQKLNLFPRVRTSYVHERDMDSKLGVAEWAFSKNCRSPNKSGN